MKNNAHAEIDCEEGSGNVFSDLGIEDADELRARAKLGAHVHRLLKLKSLKKRKAAATLLWCLTPCVVHARLRKRISLIRAVARG